MVRELEPSGPESRNSQRQCGTRCFQETLMVQPMTDDSLWTQTTSRYPHQFDQDEVRTQRTHFDAVHGRQLEGFETDSEGSSDEGSLPPLAMARFSCGYSSSSSDSDLDSDDDGGNAPMSVILKRSVRISTRSCSGSNQSRSKQHQTKNQRVGSDPNRWRPRPR